MFDEPLGRQRSQRLANERSADGEPLGDLLLTDLLTRAELAVLNELLQLVDGSRTGAPISAIS